MQTEVTFTKLGDGELAVNCQALRVEGNVIQLKLPRQVEVGSAVKIEANDTLSLGEVSYCGAEGDGYVICVDLLESLHNVTELLRLARALVG